MTTRVLWCVLATLFAIACGDDSASPSDAGDTDSGTDAGGTMLPPVNFAISARISGTPQTGLLSFVETLDADTEVDPTIGLEVPGGGIAVPGPTPGTFFTTNGQAPVVTRWRISEDRVLRQDGEISFAGSSVDASRASPANLVFTSPTRGYVLDTLSRRMVLWNPEEMVIDRTESLDQLDLPGWIPLVNRGVRRGNDLVIPVTYASFSGSINELSRVLVIDTEAEAISQVIDVDCEGVTYARVLDDGTIYVASDTASVTNRLAGLSAGEECYVRFDPGSYDIAERVLFSERTGGVPSAAMFGGTGTVVFTRVLDESLVPDGTLTIGELNGTSMWRWGRFDLAGDEDAEVFTDLEPFSTSQITFTIDDTAYVVAPGADFSGGRLFDVSGDRPVRAIQTAGIILNGFRLR
ncbi:MAG: hypothetical protein AAGE52_00450 [Myxococcota bacterium]